MTIIREILHEVQNAIYQNITLIIKH